MYHVVKDYEKIAFIGLAKNSGKTVALQKMINELSIENIKTGVTSIGHDGEKFDQINNLIKKPQITLKEGMIVATTDKLIENCEAQIEISERTKYETPIGRVSIGIVKKEGNMEIAGPSSAKGIKDISDRMLKYGAQKILIDGAINRKAISKPQIIDGLIVATGAVLNRKFYNVIQETKRKIKHILIPQLNIEFSEKHEYDNLLFDENNNFKNGFNGPLLRITQNIKNILGNLKINIIYTKRSVSESLLDYLASITAENNCNICVVARDHTNVFLEERTVEYFEKRGVYLRVRNAVKIIGISVNPTSPLSHSFDSEMLVSEIQKEFNEIPVFDVLSPKHR